MKGRETMTVMPGVPVPPLLTSEATSKEPTSEQFQAKAAALAKEYEATLNAALNPKVSSPSAYSNFVKLPSLGSEVLTDDLKAGVDLRTSKSASRFVSGGSGTFPPYSSLDNGAGERFDQALVSSDGKTALRITANGRLQEWHDGKVTDMPTGGFTLSKADLDAEAVAKESPVKARQSYYNDDVFAQWNGKELQVLKENATLAPKGKRGNVGPFEVTFKQLGQISGAQLKNATDGYISTRGQHLVINNYVPTGLVMKFGHLMLGLGHWFKSHLPRHPLGL
jgi:hypothetical protein